MSTMAVRTLVLAPGRAKPIWYGHPWVFADSVARTEGSGNDDWVRVVADDGRTLGYGFESPASAIRVRLLVRGDTEEAPDEILRRHVERAAALRRRLFDQPTHTDAYRLVHAEGDGLPGLVVDRLGTALVAQFASRGMARRREVLADILLAETGARGLLARPSGFEAAEGIARDDIPFVRGEVLPERIRIVEEGLHLEISPILGQKTGHYADQRENRLLVGRCAAGLHVLDLYCGTGGFALQSLLHGAASALAVDASTRCVGDAAENGAINGVANRLEVRRGGAKDVLAELRDARRQFGLVVVDPPNFFPRRGTSRHAVKAYRELNVRALSRVEPGGLLATFTCSAKFEPGPFLELLRSASRECRRGFSVLRELAAGPDHPVAHGLPDGRYLSGLLLRVDG